MMSAKKRIYIDKKVGKTKRGKPTYKRCATIFLNDDLSIQEIRLLNKDFVNEKDRICIKLNYHRSFDQLVKFFSSQGGYVDEKIKLKDRTYRFRPKNFQFVGGNTQSVQ